MAGILDTVDQRTQLVGENRLEILMFRLSGRQLFAINVFKVQEVLQLPKLTLIPQRHPVVCGVVNLRGQTLPVIDLSQAIGMRPLVPDERSTIIVTEYNRSVQAFLVGGVDRILNLNWESILPPPGSAGRQHYLTAITRVDEQIVEIIDVEKVLAEIVPMSTRVSAERLDDPLLVHRPQLHRRGQAHGSGTDRLRHRSGPEQSRAREHRHGMQRWPDGPRADIRVDQGFEDARRGG